jgi:hypothetical protein
VLALRDVAAAAQPERRRGVRGFYDDERDGDLSKIRGDGGLGTTIGTGGM